MCASCESARTSAVLGPASRAELAGGLLLGWLGGGPPRAPTFVEAWVSAGISVYFYAIRPMQKSAYNVHG